MTSCLSYRCCCSQTRLSLARLLLTLARCCSVYVAMAERHLMEAMSGLIREETWTPMEGADELRVLKSASSLFAALKKALGQCSNNVSRGQPMLQLLASFQVRPLS